MATLLRRSTPPRSARLPAPLEALAAAGFTLWVIWPLLAPGGYATSFDTVAYSGPNLSVTLDAVRHGRVAQWNEYLYGGVSHLGNIQAAPLYPLKWPFAWMELHRAWLSIIAMHVAILAMGMFWLVRRRLGLVAPAGLLAVVAVVGSGAVMVRMLFFEQILVLAWAPWLLGSIDAVLTSGDPPGDHGGLRRRGGRHPRRRGDGSHPGPARRRRAVAGLAVVTAAMLCAGHPQIVYVLVPLAAVWTVGRAVDLGATAKVARGPRRRDPPPAGLLRGRGPDATAALGRISRRVGPVGLGVLLGLTLAAPQLLPAADLAGRSANTGGRDLATVSIPGYSVQLDRLAGTWLGDPLETAHSATSAGYENVTFVGVVVTVTALIGLSGVRHRRRRADHLRARHCHGRRHAVEHGAAADRVPGCVPTGARLRPGTRPRPLDVACGDRGGPVGRHRHGPHPPRSDHPQ